MNVLITGASGFIGNHLCKFLEDNSTVYRLKHSKRYSRNENKIYGDLLNSDHIDLLTSESIQLDVIIHAASILGMPKNDLDLKLLYDNLKMYEHLNKIISEFNPQKVINFSSIAVYPTKTGEYTEESEIKPSTNTEGMYGLSKFCGENILEICNKNNDTKIVNLRLSQVYGDGMRNDRIYKIMEKELNDHNQISVYGNGKRVSNFIEIGELLKKVSLIINSNIEGIFNVGDKNLSYQDLALQIIQNHGNDESKISLVDEGISAQCNINCGKFNQWINQ